MQLDPSELSDLAGFFARRFPGEAQRSSFFARLRVSPEEAGATSPSAAWLSALEALQRESRLGELARLAAREGIHDENLQSVCRVLVGDRPALDPIARKRAVGITATALAAAALLAVALSNGTDVTPTAHASALAPRATVSAPGPEAAAAPPPASGTPTPLPVPAPAAQATPQPNAIASAPAVAPEMDPAHADGRCTTREGGVVGYWYAGRTSPGAQGSTIQVAQAVRVRADFPDVHNRFNARAPIRCFLSPGDTVRLSAAPIHVPGDAWWVPLHSGDLLSQ